MKKIYLSILIICFFNLSFLNAQKTDEKKYHKIFQKVKKRMNINYHTSKVFFVDYKEYIYKSNALDFLAATHIQAVRNENQKEDDNLRLARDAKNSLLKGEYYGDINKYGYSHQVIKHLGGNTYLNILTDIRFRLVLDDIIKETEKPASCSRNSIDVVELYANYQIYDSINTNGNFWVLIKEGEKKCYFDEEKFINKIPKPKKSVEEERELIGSWNNSVVQYRTVYIINKNDYAIVAHKHDVKYTDNNNHSFLLNYKHFYKKVDGLYYEASFEGIMPRFDKSERCGFNRENLYTKVIKQTTPVENINKLKQKFGLTEMQKVPQLPYNEFCNRINKPSEAMEKNWE